MRRLLPIFCVHSTGVAFKALMKGVRMTHRVSLIRSERD